jgi:hypothetical protein
MLFNESPSLLTIPGQDTKKKINVKKIGRDWGGGGGGVKEVRNITCPMLKLVQGQWKSNVLKGQNC